MATNRNLANAKSVKNDEFYTLFSDVDAEMWHYAQHFGGQSVFCNCDDPKASAFWQYFHLNFSSLRLKKLVATHYERGKSSYAIEYVGGNDGDFESGTVISLVGDGDFESDECVRLLHESDIVVTNPPFSIAQQKFLPLIVSSGKKFLVIGDINWIPKALVFPLFVRNQIWLGINNVKAFLQPDGKLKRFGNKRWFTNMEHERRRQRLQLKKKFRSDEYLSYINYPAINVDRVADIPSDYDGLMSVPITFLQYHNPDQFEIVGCPDYKGDFGRDYLGIKRLGEEWLKRYREQGGTGNYTANMAVPVYFDNDGRARRPFSKVIIRKKQVWV